MNRKLLLIAILIIATGSAYFFHRNQTPKESSSSEWSIAVLLPETGPGASLGQYIRQSIDLAVEDRKSKGLSVPRIKFLDSKNNPKEATTALQSFLAHTRPDAVITSMSSVSKAVQPMLDEIGIPSVATTTALTGLPQNSKFMVRVYPTSNAFAAPVARWAAERYGKLAVVAVDDDFGRANMQEFENVVVSLGKTIVAKEIYPLAGTDHRNLADKISGTGADGVFVTGYGPSYIAMIKALREQAKNLPILSEASLANPAVLQALGSAADDIVFTASELDLTAPPPGPAADFKVRYVKRYAVDPFLVCGFAYDSFNLIASAKDSSGAVSKDTLVQVSLPGIMGALRLANDGECNTQFLLVKREGGRTMLLE